MVLGPPGLTYPLFFLQLAITTAAGVAFPPLGAAVLARPVPSTLLGADRPQQAVVRSCRLEGEGCLVMLAYLLLRCCSAGSLAGSYLAIREFLVPPLLAPRWRALLVAD